MVLRFYTHLIQFFRLIPNMVSKNSRMHLNALYDQKTSLGQPTQFCKKIEKRVGKHFLMAQFINLIIGSSRYRRLINFDVIIF